MSKVSKSSITASASLNTASSYADALPAINFKNMQSKHGYFTFEQRAAVDPPPKIRVSGQSWSGANGMLKVGE